MRRPPRAGLRVPGTDETTQTVCGCAAATHSRRRFLQGLALLAGTGVVSSTYGSAFVSSALASEVGAKPNVLVVLSLRGGADGLSLVVPWDDPAYARARPTIAVPTASLLARDATFGLHPAMAPLMPLWRAGSMAAVHATGLAAPNRSHFAAMEEIEDADPGSQERRGWLNRLVGLNREETPIEAVQMGSPVLPGSLYGPEPVLAVSGIDDMVIPGRENPDAYARRLASLRATWKDAPGRLGQGARSALAVSAVFEDVVGEDDGPLHGATYPAGDLGAALAGTVRLVRADIGAEVVTVDAGSWDMHVGIGTPEKGLLAASVAELSEALAAFYTDLGDDGSRVTVVTVSEFGRRVEENAGRGLDHGWGNVMLVLGAGVRGGRYYATSWPGLGSGQLVDGDLAVTTDYRSVLTEVVRARFDVDTRKVFPGFTPAAVGVMGG